MIAGRRMLLSLHVGKMCYAFSPAVESPGGAETVLVGGEQTCGHA